MTPAPAGAAASLAQAASVAVVGYGRLMTDGAGSVSGAVAASIGGAWSDTVVTGEYTVKGDCTFSMTLSSAAGLTQHFDGVLTRTGDTVSLLQTDAGTGLSGVLARAAAFCDATAPAGSMKLQVSGVGADGGAMGTVATLQIDEQGNVAAAESRFGAGKATRASSSGTLVVNGDCTVSLSLSAASDGSLARYRGVLVDHYREIFLVRSDAGVTAGGGVSGQ